MDFKTLLIGFVKTELSFYFVTSLAESVIISVNIKKGDKTSKSGYFPFYLLKITLKGVVLSLFNFTY